MTSLKYLKVLLGLFAVLTLTLFIHSCKGDSSLTGNEDPENTGQVTISVTSPVNGDTLRAASYFEIKWTTNSTSKLKLEYSVDGGASWKLIVSNLSGNSYVWDPIPNISTYIAKVRVSTMDSSVVSLSPGVFSIIKTSTKSLAIRKPNGGEVLNSGEAFRIEWISYNVTSVKIEFSSNNGSDWNSIVSTYPADSSYYLWNPVPNITSDNCLLKITDVFTDTLKDVSKAVFKISSPKSIKVTSPNGGESWEGNSTKTITWYSSQIANVKIEYSTDNGYTWNLINSSAPSNGIFIWSPVPNTPSTNAKIKITNAIDNFPSDVSDSVFTISPESALKLLAPNGGENWMSGSGQNIKWTTVGNTPNQKINKNPKLFNSSKYFTQSVVTIKLEYTTDGGSNWILIKNDVPNNGNYYWDSIPSLNSSLCLVRVSDSERGIPFDVSDAKFTIYNTVQQEIIVTKPNGGEIFPAGSTQSITWTSTGIAAVNIDYTIDNGINWTRLATNTPSNGYYSWTQVPSTASTNCKIKITDAADGFPSDQSNAVFTISPEPDIKVLTPNGGEILQGTQSFEITWTSENLANVKIEFSTNSGANWTSITSSTPSDGSYLWSNIPNINSSLCRIKVSDADDGQPYDLSDNNFSITNSIAQTITLTSPNGGEIWESGTTNNITWNAVGISSVKIELSTNNGINWSVISAAAPNNGIYQWNVPAFISAQCKIRVSDASDDNPSDESANTFSITSPKLITVTSPNGGENWEVNGSKTITWYSSQVSNVKIEYSTDNGYSWILIAANAPSNGAYTWNPIPNTPSTNAKVRITNASGSYPSDMSDTVFAITPESGIKVLIPNGGENWMSGTGQYIKWTTFGMAPEAKINKHKGSLFNHSKYMPENIANVKIEYSINGGSSWTTIISSTPNNGTYYWNSVPSHNSALCLVRISDADLGIPSDISDDKFTIYNTVQQEVIVTSPNGGEIWPAGSTQAITWSSSGIATVNIDYTIDNGNNWTRVVSNLPSNGYYSWTQVPSTASTNCKIKISDAVDGFPSDQSNSVFTISPEPYVTVLSPNGGELIQSNQPFDITWTSENIANVKIEFTTNNGANWSIIIASTPSDGLYQWDNVPNINSSLCRIKISDAADGQPFDISDNNFVISNLVIQTIAVVSPNGGERWESGTSHNITWTSTGIANIKIELSTNNGSNWTVVSASVPNAGSYEWNVPNVNSTQCRIRLSDALDGNPIDESNSTFTITPIQSLTVTYPNGGEVIVAGTAFDITWQSSGIEKVKIEYTTNNGLLWTDWFVLVDSIPSTGSFSTSFSIPTNQYRIKISDAYDGSPTDQSNGVFTISPQPQRTVAVISPNGGENWLVGTTSEIRWFTENIDSVKLEYTLNGGAEWKTIASKVPSNGLYNWVVPVIQYRSDLCKVKVSDAKNGTPYDLSDTTFSIHPQTKLLRWNFPNGGEFIWQDTLIIWTSSGITNVNLEYTENNGVSWLPIASNIPSTGAYYWHINPLGTPSSLARVRVTDAVDPDITDMSDSYFFLRIRGGLDILTPSNGRNNTYASGSTMDISWKGIDKVNYINIEFSNDNGKSWNLIEGNIKSDFRKVNYYAWNNIPERAKGNILIRLSDVQKKYSVICKTVKIN